MASSWNRAAVVLILRVRVIYVAVAVEIEKKFKKALSV
jgi:hypothetical protein